MAPIYLWWSCAHYNQGIGGNIWYCLSRYELQCFADKHDIWYLPLSCFRAFHWYIVLRNSKEQNASKWSQSVKTHVTLKLSFMINMFCPFKVIALWDSVCFIDIHTCNVTYRSNNQLHYINFTSDLIIKEHVNQKWMVTVYWWVMQEVCS